LNGIPFQNNGLLV